MVPRLPDSRDKIVSAARSAFYTKGYEQTSFADLAKLSGIPKGNFYYHFRSKEDLLRAVIEARDERIRSQLEQWRTELAQPAQRLQRFVQMLTNDATDLAAYGCPMGSLLTELGKHRADLQQEASSMFAAFIAFLRDQFLELGLPTEESDELALRVMARCQGAVMLAHAYRDTQVLSREVSDIQAWLKTLY